VSAAVAIPLAMGYGMFAFSSLGENYFADGALAGLVTALVVGIVCVLLGDKTTTVYAPRVNSTFFLGILIYGLVHSHAPAITAGGVPFILAVAFWIILLGGVLEALFGLVKLGTLIKFTPQPVMAGFQNAAAALLFLVQLGPCAALTATSHSRRCRNISPRLSRSAWSSPRLHSRRCGTREKYSRKLRRFSSPSSWAALSIFFAG
jgi:MFS superfamily sulfate permease-like transporter